MKNFVPLPAFLIVLFLMVSLFVLPGNAVVDHPGLVKGKKILIVASYHKGYTWADDIVKTLKHELVGAELTVFYMDSKRNFAGAAEKAREAYELYLELQPDAVITIDDNAQSYFVVPYLSEKVTVPVIFCGVNDDATKYGFPTSNVTGVVEKKHYRESISFAQIINPKIKAIGVLYRPSTSNNINIAQVEKEKGSYSADVVATVAVDSAVELRAALTDYSAKVDAFILMNMTGIVDEKNRQMERHESIALVVGATDLVTIGASDWEVGAGALCGVIKSGKEQGVLAASQLFAHWEGRVIKDLPIIQNKNGQRYINLKTLEKLQIQLKPEMIVGTKIISGN